MKEWKERRNQKLQGKPLGLPAMGHSLSTFNGDEWGVNDRLQMKKKKKRALGGGERG